MREIHRPYRDSIGAVSDYLLQHAAQDDLVYVPGFADREALTFGAGHRVLFCCVLDQDTPLPRATVESLGGYLSATGTTPDWIVVFGGLRREYRDKVKASHAVVARPEVFFYPTQRHADAAGLYRRLLEVTPESARTHANLGVTLYHLGRVEEAVRRFEQALSPDPALETARVALERIRRAAVASPATG